MPWPHPRPGAPDHTTQVLQQAEALRHLPRLQAIQQRGRRLSAADASQRATRGRVVALGRLQPRDQAGNRRLACRAGLAQGLRGQHAQRHVAAVGAEHGAGAGQRRAQLGHGHAGFGAHPGQRLDGRDVQARRRIRALQRGLAQGRRLGRVRRLLADGPQGRSLAIFVKVPPGRPEESHAPQRRQILVHDLACGPA